MVKRRCIRCFGFVFSCKFLECNSRWGKMWWSSGGGMEHGLDGCNGSSRIFD